MATPEKFILPEPEEPQTQQLRGKKIARHIEVRRAHTAEPEVGVEEIDPLESGKLFEMPLYEAFDARAELKKLREGLRAQKLLSAEERRGRLRAGLQQIRETLARQEAGIGEAISGIESAIQKNPDASHRELLGGVAELAPKYRFSDSQLRDFWLGVVLYCLTHGIVARYRKEFPNDDDFFEACFGQKPDGKVTVEQRPMFLYIRCFEDADYVTAFTFREAGGDTTKITPEMRRRALFSGGVASPKVNLNESGIVAVERSSLVSESYTSMLPTDYRHSLPKGGAERVELKSLEGRITIKTAGAETFFLETYGKTKEGRPTGINLLQEKNGKRTMLRALKYVPDRKNERFGILVDEQGQSHGQVQYEVEGEDPRAPYITITWTYGGVSVTNHHDDRAEVLYSAYPHGARLKEEASESMRVHEEQHIMDGIFSMLASRLKEGEVVERVARTARTVEEGRTMLAAELSRSARRDLGIDAAARDEILAYYRQGVAPGRIFRTLMRGPNYAYREIGSFKKQIAELPKVISEKIRANIDIVSELVAVGHASDNPQSKRIGAVPMLVHPDIDVKPYVDRAFGADYQKDVKRWLQAIGALEHKGYNRNEIISMLYGERVPDWQALARRAPEKPGAHRTPDTKPPIPNV